MVLFVFRLVGLLLHIGEALIHVVLFVVVTLIVVNFLTGATRAFNERAAFGSGTIEENET